jgi:hypothetical protein
VGSPFASNLVSLEVLNGSSWTVIAQTNLFNVMGMAAPTKRR